MELKQLSCQKSIKKIARLCKSGSTLSISEKRQTEASSRLQLSIPHPCCAELLPTDLHYHMYVTPYGLICCTPSEASLGLNNTSLLVLLAA